MAEYKAAGDENVELKKQLVEIETTLTARAVAAEQQANSLAKQIEEKDAEATKVKQQYEENMQLALEKKELEREKSLMEMERRYQEEIAQLNAAHIEEIRSLYDKINALRKLNDENREKLQVKIDTLKREKIETEIK